jgi:hypothetical protein
MAVARLRDEEFDAPPGPGLTAYTGMVGIALVATIIGLVFVFLDYNTYRDKPPDVKQFQAGGPPPAAAPAQPQPAAPKPQAPTE